MDTVDGERETTCWTWAPSLRDVNSSSRISSGKLSHNPSVATTIISPEETWRREGMDEMGEGWEGRGREREDSLPFGVYLHSVVNLQWNLRIHQEEESIGMEHWSNESVLYSVRRSTRINGWKDSLKMIEYLSISDDEKSGISEISRIEWIIRDNDDASSWWSNWMRRRWCRLMRE